MAEFESKKVSQEVKEDKIEGNFPAREEAQEVFSTGENEGKSSTSDTEVLERNLPATETEVIAAREKAQEVLSDGEEERRGFRAWLPGQREKINIKIAEKIEEVLNVYDSIRDEKLIDTADIRVMYRMMDFFVNEKDQVSQDTYHKARDVYDKIKLKLPKII